MTNVTELGAWQATLAAHDDMANGGATDPRRSADGWYEPTTRHTAT